MEASVVQMVVTHGIQWVHTSHEARVSPPPPSHALLSSLTGGGVAQQRGVHDCMLYGRAVRLQWTLYDGLAMMGVWLVFPVRFARPHRHASTASK